MGSKGLQSKNPQLCRLAHMFGVKTRHITLLDDSKNNIDRCKSKKWWTAASRVNIKQCKHRPQAIWCKDGLTEAVLTEAVLKSTLNLKKFRLKGSRKGDDGMGIGFNAIEELLRCRDNKVPARQKSRRKHSKQ